MAVRADVETRGNRRIGKHHIDIMHCEVRRQPLERAFTASDAHRPLQTHHGFEYPVGNLFRQDVIDADHQSHGSRGRAMLQRFEKVLAEAKDLVRIPVNQPPNLRWNECAPGLCEELLPEARFKRTQLCTDRRCGQGELLTRARKAAGSDHGPEVQQMLIVQSSDDRHHDSTPVAPGDEWGESVQLGGRTSTFIEAHVFAKNEETTELILIDLNKDRTRHSPRDAQRTARRYADGARARRSTRQTPADLQSRDLVFVRRTDRAITVTVGVDLPLPDGPAMRRLRPYRGPAPPCHPRSG